MRKHLALVIVAGALCFVGVSDAAPPKLLAAPKTSVVSQILREGDGTAIQSLSLDSAGKTLAFTARFSKVATLLDAQTGKTVGTVAGGMTSELAALSPDGTKIAIAAVDLNSGLYDVKSGKSITGLGSGDPVRGLVWSAKGGKVASLVGVRAIVSNGDGKGVGQVYGDIGMGVNAAAFSPSETLVATGWDDRTVVFSSTSEAKPISKPFFSGIGLVEKGRLPALDAKISALSWGKDDHTLFVGDASGTLTKWDVSDPANPKKLTIVSVSESAIRQIQLAPSGQSLAVLGNDLSGEADLMLFDIGKWRPKLTWKRGTGAATLSAFVFAPDSKSIYFGDKNGEISRLPVSAFSFYKPIEAPILSATEPHELGGQLDSPNALVFSPDGKVVAVSDGAALFTLDIATGKRRALPNAHTQTITSVAFSHDGNLVASGSSDSLQVADRTTDKVLWSVKGWGGAAGFSANGALLYANVGTTVKIFDAKSGKELGLPHASGQAQRIALSPDGKWLALAFVSHGGSYSPDELVECYNTQTLAQVWSKKATGYIRALQFSPDSRLLAFDFGDRADGYPDGYKFEPGKMGVAVWETATGNNTPFSDLTTWRDAVGALAFSSDGKRLFAVPEKSREESTARVISLQDATPKWTETDLPLASALTASPNGKLLAVAPKGSRVKILPVP